MALEAYHGVRVFQSASDPVVVSFVSTSTVGLLVAVDPDDLPAGVAVDTPILIQNPTDAATLPQVVREEIDSVFDQVTTNVILVLVDEGDDADAARTKVTDFSPEGFETFKRDLMEMSVIPGMPVATDLAAIAAAAGQAGIAQDDILAFTEAAAKIGTAFDISADLAGESLSKLMTGLGLTVDEAVLLTDSMNHLSNSQAATAAQILDVVRRVGPSAKTYGFAAEDVSAFASAMIAAGAESEVAATSFMNMGRALTVGESATKRQVTAMKRLGFDSAEIARAMQEDAVDTTLKVIEAIGTMPAEVQASISSDLFGNEARALGVLLTNTDLLHESLGLVANEGDYAGSSFKEFENRAATFGAELAAFRNTISNLGITIGSILLPPLTDMADRLKPIVKAVADWAAEHPGLVSGIVQATAGLIGFRVALVGLRFAGLFSLGAALQVAALGMTTVGRAAGGVTRAVSSSMALNAALAAGSGQQVTRMSKLAAALRGIAGVTGLSAVAGGVVSVLGAVSAPVWGTAAVVIGIIAAAGLSIYRNWDRVSSVLVGVGQALRDQLLPAWEKFEPLLAPFRWQAEAVGWALEKVVNGAKWLASSIKDLFTGDFFARNILTDDEKANVQAGAREIANMILDPILALPKAFLDIGSYALMSLLRGMKSGAGSVVDWLKTRPGAWLGAIAGGGESSGDESGDGEPKPQARALGGSFSAGSLLVGEHGPERLYASRAGFVAHHQHVRRMAQMSRIIERAPRMPIDEPSVSRGGDGSRPTSGARQRRVARPAFGGLSAARLPKVMARTTAAPVIKPVVNPGVARVMPAPVVSPAVMPVPMASPGSADRGRVGAGAPTINITGDFIFPPGTSVDAGELARELGAQIGARLQSQHADYF